MILKLQAGEKQMRLDRFLQEELPQYSRSRLQSWIKEGRVLVNGKPAKSSLQLAGGESIDVEPGELPKLKAEPEDIPLNILYEDEAVLAVDKPAGMVVHAGAGIDSGTLVNALLHHFDRLSSVSGDLRPGIVHRLDRYTSGVILVARTDEAHRKLANQFTGRSVEKTYLTVVHGRMEQETGRVDKLITRDPRRRTKMTARLEHGRKALTKFRVLERFDRLTLLEVKIGTGRTHQIRVHLSTIGYPVAGDTLYGAPVQIKGVPKLDRYFLHAQRIRFRSPASGDEVLVESPLPEELAEWLEGLRSPEE